MSGVRFELTVRNIRTIQNPHKGERTSFSMDRDEREFIDIEQDWLKVVLTESEWEAVKAGVLTAKKYDGAEKV